jgi:hypothetical protein
MAALGGGRHSDAGLTNIAELSLKAFEFPK